MKLQNIEKRIYELLGVNIFRKYVLFPYEKILKFFHFDPGYKLKSKSKHGLMQYKKLSKGFAIAHFATLIGVSILGIVFSPNISYWIINIGLNAYCIMVQRYNQIRIDTILEKYNKKENLTDTNLLETDTPEIIMKSHNIKDLTTNITPEINIENSYDNVLKRTRKLPRK